METQRAAPRPLALAALALAAGGAAGPALPGKWGAAVLACAALALAALLLAPRRAWMAAALCALLAALGALRARIEAARPPAVEGRYEPGRALPGGERGRLAPGTLELELAPGLVRDGERVRVLGGRPASRPARGPAAGPGRDASAPRAHVLPDELVRLAPASEPRASLRGALAELRRRLVARTGAIEDPLARALAAALAFGEVGALDPELPDLFVRTGTYHALAVSGLQVVLVAALVFGPAAALVASALAPLGARFAARAGELVRACAIALYVPLAGGAAPVVRAALCFGFARAAPFVRAPRAARLSARAPLPDVEAGPAGAARASGVRLHLPRRADGLALWSFALFLECALRPCAALDLSVQLSYAATLGLMLGTGPLARRLAPAPPAVVDALGRPRPALARALAVRAARAATSALAASACAVLATLPFTWARLGEWSPLGALATVAVAPLLLALLAGGWLAALAPALVPDAPLELAARLTARALELFDALPGTPEPLPPRPMALVGLAVGLAFAALVARGERVRALAARASALLAALLLLPWTRAPRGLELAVLDVGAGTCAAVRAPGLGTWVFDAGSRDRPGVAREALGPLLREWDAGTVGVALSHAARDHDGALDWVLERHPPRVWAGALPARLAERLPHTALWIDVGRGRAALPALQGSCAAAAAWLERGTDLAGNEGSRALRIAWCDVEIVLAGDAEGEGLAGLLALDAFPRPLALLLAPHHGSQTPHLGELLEAWQPREVWVSGPADPPIGPELDRRGLCWRSTGRDGPLGLALPAPPGWNGTCNPAPP